MAEHSWCSNIFKTSFLCVLVRIASVEDSEKTRKAVRELDASVNDIPGVTCRVWLFMILRRLGRLGVLGGGDGDWDARMKELQDECMSFGNEERIDAARNKQPRPVVESRLVVISSR